MKLQRLLFLLLLPIFLSCKSQVRKNQAVQFLRHIDNVYDTLDIKGDKFLIYFEQVSIIARANNNFQLDQNKLDSLQQFYYDYLKAYDKGLQKLETFKEFDDSFQIVSLNSQALKNFRSSWMEVIPSYLKTFKSGWKEADENDRIKIQSIASIMKKYQKVTDDLLLQIETQGLKFGEKYQFKYVVRKF